ncbi:hypothetical protein AB0P15_15735 [Streptomyces sp. NPDC087917]|uniref:hypothetical protein n=1 Tax=Streptomyces sp. NPDC087917 TaxID=3155060 RepID=UPI003431381B
MIRPRTAAVTLALLLPLAAPLLAGCGIKPTGVVESGAPAKVEVASPGGAPMAYFVGPDDRLVPSPAIKDPTVGPGTGLARLLLGPGPTEREAGIGTRLPGVSTDAAIRSGPAYLGAGRFEVRLPFDVGPLEPLARSQIVCTALSGLGTQVEVILSGPDTQLPAARCDIGA